MKYNNIIYPKANYGKKNGRYIDGRYCKDKKYYCKDCGVEISQTCKSGLCRSCSHKGKKLTNEHKMKLKKYKGKKAFNYIDGRTLIQHYCIESNCNNKISLNNWRNGQGRCQFCARKNNWKSEKYREKVIKATLKALKLKPNRPEKLLQKIFPKEYKFVGDGKIILGGFNPDFININGQKKIIELYGNYWHNKSEVKERDKRRIKTYKKFGYKTLIIWESELKEIDKVRNKIKKFNEKV